MQPFRPEDLLAAHRKVARLRRALEEAGIPVSEPVAREAVARGWGWLGWGELRAALDAGGTPSKPDEDLTGLAAGVMAETNRLALSRRQFTARVALERVLGLHLQEALYLMTHLALTGAGEPEGGWMSREAFAGLRAACEAPRPDWAAELVEGMKKGPAHPLPPHRPRR